MSAKNRQTPRLIFFRDTPQNWLDRPPLASSLQNLETSFLLLAMARYPSALVATASAIESAVQAAFPSLLRKRFEELFEHANSNLQAGLSFNTLDLSDFRRKRNEIIHFGFSPSDDEVAAALLLNTGYPFIERCYKSYFNFGLKRKGVRDGGLLLNLDRHLDVAQIVYQKTKNIPNVRASSCFIPLAHEIRWRIRESLLSNWEAEVLDLEDEEFERRHTFQERQKNKLLRDTFEVSWEFDCPICDYPESLICELEREPLEKGEIRLNRAVCVSCGLEIPKNSPALADELCADQVVECRSQILQEHDINR